MPKNHITTNFFTVFVDPDHLLGDREQLAINLAKSVSNNPRGSWTVVFDPGDAVIVRQIYDRRKHRNLDV